MALTVLNMRFSWLAACAPAAAVLIRASWAYPGASPEDRRTNTEVDTAMWARDSSAHAEPLKESKYFYEAGAEDALGHYDRRFFRRIMSYEDRREAQRDLIRSYLTICRQEDIETWIAHGTLLGWWWNGKALPWDFDIDVQVPDATLQHMGRQYNQSRHHYVSPERKVRREYLLDVNPFIANRDRGEGFNVIDARWIDVRNGLFIDITGLSEIHPDDEPGIWQCKNYHRYNVRDLFPLRESIYEGVPTLVPYSYDRVLTDEYEAKALVETEFENHHWDPEAKEWVKVRELQISEILSPELARPPS